VSKHCHIASTNDSDPVTTRIRTSQKRNHSRVRRYPWNR